MKGRLAKFKAKSSGTLRWMSTLACVESSYRNKLKLYLSQIKSHLITISELSREKKKKLFPLNFEEAVFDDRS